MYKNLVLFMLLAGTICSQTTLTGSIENLTLTADKNPYIIDEKLTISDTGQLTIENGCILLFKPFTGIVVNGSLIVEGTLEDPVVFTTINDSIYNKESNVFANPFDWNGILITEKAQKVKLSNFILAYSVYGVRSMKEELIIANGSFKNNGQFHMTVKGDIEPVADGVPYSYKNSTISNQSSRNNSIKGKLPLVLAISGLTCGGGSVVSGIVFSHSRKTYSQISETGKLNRTENIIKASFAGTIAFGTAALILLPTALVSHNKKNMNDQEKRVLILPLYIEGPGIIAHVSF